MDPHSKVLAAPGELSGKRLEAGEFNARVKLVLTRDCASLWGLLVTIRRPVGTGQVVNEQAELDSKTSHAK